MKIFSANKISKAYGDKKLFQDIEFHIQTGDRIGIIGVNGTGKSSLLKLMAHIDEPDSGSFTHPKDYSIGYLAQEPELNDNLTVMEQIFQADAQVIQLIKAYEEALQQLNQDPENCDYQQRLFQLQKQMDVTNAWEATVHAQTVLTKLGLTNTDQLVGHLSGGQKKRVALAQVLIETPDLLLLDEPTNHLDYESIQWLEEFLKKYDKSLVIITHDRYFLDNVTNRIMELHNGNLYTYTGNYEAFIEAKAARLELTQQKEAKMRNVYRSELEWMRAGARARSTKQKARIQRFEQLESQLGQVQEEREVDIALKGSRLGRQVFELIDASKSFGSQTILRNFNWLVKRGDRYGIVGKNGSGKSTLLNLLSGALPLDDGEMIVGQTVKIAHYTQQIEEMDTHKRMISYIREAGEVVETATGETISAAEMLERFLFPKSTHGTLIQNLSGGERRRLYLLKLLMGKPNVLLFDEPTNDLDTETLTVLESYIGEFPGVVISVSHDRYFLDKTANELLIFHGNGKVDHYFGTYTEYLEEKKMAQEETSSKHIHVSQVAKAEEQEKRKLTYKERKEWEGIEDEISKTEEELQLLQNELNETGSDFEYAQQLMEQIEEKNSRLEYLIERWTYLSEFEG